MNELPTDPVSALKEGAIQMHELYLSWVDSGFTEEQAFSLLLAVLTEQTKGNR